MTNPPPPDDVAAVLARELPAHPISEGQPLDPTHGGPGDNRERLPDGTIVNPDGSVIPPMDPDLLARIEAAKDERGVVHDPDLANEYFEAMVRQGDEIRRLAGWPDPIIEDGKVFPSAGEDAPALDYREGEPQVEIGPSTLEPPDDPNAISVVVY